MFKEYSMKVMGIPIRLLRVGDELQLKANHGEANVVVSRPVDSASTSVYVSVQEVGEHDELFSYKEGEEQLAAGQHLWAEVRDNEPRFLADLVARMLEQ